MQHVLEQQHLALGRGDLAERRLQALLELAAVLGTGDHAGEIQRYEAGAAQRGVGLVEEFGRARLAQRGEAASAGRRDDRLDGRRPC